MKRVIVVTSLLAVLAAVSAVSIVYIARNYARSMEVVRTFRLALSDLELLDDGRPSVRVEFLIANNSAVDLTLDDFRFSLHLNDQFIGSNYEPLPMRIVAGHSEQTVSFVIPIEAYYQQFLDQASDSDSYSWSVNGRYNIVLPFKEKAIWLDLRDRWSGS